MKQKIVFHDEIHNKITVKTVEVRNPMHLDAQIRFPSRVHKPKKGKGSFKRNKKVEYD